MAYPISYSVPFVEPRSRLTTFFRYLLAFPHFFMAAFVGIGAFFAVVAAWFAIVFTGRYPAGLYGFNAGFLRYLGRVNGYISLATDAYPPFSLGEDADYPIQVQVAPALEQYDRIKTLLRIILLIPVYVIAYALQIVQMVASVISWFWIVVTGKQNDGLHSAILLGLGYNVKAYGYYMLLTETWPPFSESTQVGAGVPPAGTLPPQSTPQQTAPPPKAPEAPSGGSFTSGDPLS
ncbi:DUF4389 domain-containing protein [Paraconexibacter sp.]|uniref:DUF4389 domain-containing protein n=1 Tax=Paraconexibacter sp. TaxID=2949640 RepID=UPI0035623563